MSQFRIKQIDQGLPDDWDFRINDSGIIVGDDVVAEDPNELAEALSETQDLILHATTYAPSALIDSAHGALERIKIIEDTVGTTSLQDAYENGRFITVQPGRNLVFGSGGEIEMDSSGNLKLSPSTMKIYNGSLELNFSYSSVTSTTTDLTFGTLSPTKDCLLKGGRSLYFRDGNLTSNISLAESGATSLTTTSQSIIGAINEISTGFAGTDFQQIYDQSSPSEIATTFTNGAVKITNDTGNPTIPALIINGNEEVEALHAEEITVSPTPGSPNLTIGSGGEVNTIGDILTSSKVSSPRLENLSGELTLADARGSIALSETSDGSLETVKQTLFGAINELKTQIDANGLVAAAMSVEHNASTGIHKIINTQASAGDNSTSRFNIKNDLGITKVTVNADGEIVCDNIDIAGYDLGAEALANETHRSGDGTDHSAVSAHLAASNPHNVVATFAKQGSAQLTGHVTVSEGTGVTVTQTGNNIEIAAPVGSTLQGVYDSQATGDWELDTAGGKDLYFKDSTGIDILHLDDTAITAYKNIVCNGDKSITSNSGNLSLDAATATKKVIIEGVDFTDGTTMSIDDSVPTNIVGAINHFAEQEYIEVVNGSGNTLLKGTAVCVRQDGELWITYPDPDPANAFNSNWGEPSLMWHVTGIAYESIAAGSTGRVKLSGGITAAVGGIFQFYPGDTLYVAKTGFSTITINDDSTLLDGDYLTLDTGGAAKKYTAVRGGGAEADLGEFDVSTNLDPNKALDETRDNLFDALDNKTWMGTGTPFYSVPFIAGKKAEGRIDVSAAGTAGDIITITPNDLYGGNAITLTAVAMGATPTLLQYALGATPAETAIYIAEAINRTTRDNGSGGEGHLLQAEAYADAVIVKHFQPGAAGNNTILTGSNVLVTNPSGGTSELNAYMATRGSTGTSHLCASSNSALISITDFGADESDKPYLCRREMADPTRSITEHDRLLKVGKVISQSGFDVTFRIEIEEPEYYKRDYRGALNDPKY